LALLSFLSRSLGGNSVLDPFGTVALFFFSVVSASRGVRSDFFSHHTTEPAIQIFRGRGFGLSITSSQIWVESLWGFSSLWLSVLSFGGAVYEPHPRLTNRSSQPLAAAMRTFNFMKLFCIFATLAAASGGSAPSR